MLKESRQLVNGMFHRLSGNWRWYGSGWSTGCIYQHGNQNIILGCWCNFPCDRLRSHLRSEDGHQLKPSNCHGSGMLPVSSPGVLCGRCRIREECSVYCGSDLLID